jgi:1-acyl-sn-glycerol-3-phosphate acyltransferase
MMIFRNLLFYLGVIPSVMLFGTVALLIFFLPYQYRYWIITRWSYFFIFWAKATCGLQYQVEGISHLPKKPVIVLANHQSTWETIFFQMLLPPQCWVLKKDLLYIPLFGWGLALLEPIAIHRKQLNSIKELLRQGKQRLQQHRWIIIFPEGTRAKPGEDRRFSRTGAALAKSSHTPIIPIAHNAGVFWPKGVLIKKPGIIKISIGPMIEPEEKSVTEINQIAETWIKEKIHSFDIS